MSNSPDLPARFVERLRLIVPPERVASVLASYSMRKPLFLRVNTLRATRDEVSAELEAEGIASEPFVALEEVLQCESEFRDRLVRSASVSAGRAYLQNPSSLLPVWALDVCPGQRVLDLAAAPGGKTLHLAAMMQDQGELTAVEFSRPRYYRLKAQVERFGVTCVSAVLGDGRRFGGQEPDAYDRVLLDAPCSGEALLGHSGEEEADERPNWSLQKISRCAAKQVQLLRSAADACKPGGMVVYCTCTTAPEENEAVLSLMMAELGHEFEIEPLRLPAIASVNRLSGLTVWQGEQFADGVELAERILPNGIFNAFFLAKLRKRLEI